MITILRGDVKLIYKQFLFPGGEVGIKLDTENYKFTHHVSGTITVVARLQSAMEVLELALIKDALVRLIGGSVKINLLLPYVPYGRQDRVCVRGESFSVQVFARLIAAMSFNQVTIVDPHSEITPAIFETLGVSLRVITQLEVIQRFDDFANRIMKGVVFISPDAGANKKTADIAKYFAHSEFIRADKMRNLATGEIKETIVYADNLGGRDVVIADDICDGGRTFTELAKVLKAKNAGKVILYVTHGIFSKGTDALLGYGIDEIFITDSWGGETQWSLPKVTALKLEESFNILR